MRDRETCVLELLEGTHMVRCSGKLHRLPEQKPAFHRIKKD